VRGKGTSNRKEGHRRELDGFQILRVIFRWNNRLCGSATGPSPESDNTPLQTVQNEQMRFNPPGGPSVTTVTVPKPAPLYLPDCVLHTLTSLLPSTFFFSLISLSPLLITFAIFASQGSSISSPEDRGRKLRAHTLLHRVLGYPTRCSQAGSGFFSSQMLE